MSSGCEDHTLSKRAATELPSLALPKLDSYVGALLIGTYFAIALYGLTSQQTFRYYRAYTNDPRPEKAMVGLVWLLDTVHSMLICHTCYYYLVSNYFNPLSLLDGVWSMQISITLTGVMATVAHIFFALRVSQITKYLWAARAVAVASLICLGFTIATTVMTIRETSFVKFERFTWLVCTTLGLNTVSDLIITGCLCLYLQKRKTGFEKTNIMINKLLLYVINTGIINIAYNIAVLICASVVRSNLVFIGMFFVINKLYANSLLAVLNAKGVKREIASHPHDINAVTPPAYELYGSRRRTSNVEAVPVHPSPRPGGSTLKRQATLDVRITREIHTVRDNMQEESGDTSERPSVEKETASSVVSEYA